MTKKFIIGLTGNIASGKSTVLEFFKSLGIEVISADEIAKKLTKHGQPALEKIRGYFGLEVIDEKGQLKRSMLRQLIFSDPVSRLWLENLLHPLIRESIEKELLSSKSPYTVVEIPLLKTKDAYPYFDRILVILADRNIQIKRLIERDNISEEDALKILATQPKDEERKKLADDLIFNSENKEKLFKEIKKLHNKYLHLANKKTS